MATLAAGQPSGLGRCRRAALGAERGAGREGALGGLADEVAHARWARERPVHAAPSRAR